MNSTRLLEKYPLVTVGLGMKGGGTGTVIRWTVDGAKVVGKFPMSVRNRGGAIWYSRTDLRRFWTLPHAELGDKSLNRLIFDEGVKAMGLSSWGADILLVGEDGKPIGGINYPSALQCTPICRWIGEIDAGWWHQQLGGAAQAAYQPLGQLAVLESQLHDESWSQVKAVVPLTDWLRWKLTETQGHDATMLQSQGLLGDARLAVAEKFGAPLPDGVLAPWPILGQDALAYHLNVHIAPFTHDSVPARNVGFSTGADVVVWTGSWIGVAARIGDEIVPNDATRKAGLSFEGLYPRALQRNVCCGGPVYRELLDRNDLQLTMAGAAEAILTYTGSELPPIDLKKLETMSPDEGANYIQQVLSDADQANNPVRAMATLVHSIVEAVYNDLQALGEVLGKEIKSVAIVGGWAENNAFITLLQAKGLEVHIPPCAAYATDAGLAADVLRRVTVQEGEPMDVADILAQLPTEIEE